jgi:hypothetical protein
MRLLVGSPRQHVSQEWPQMNEEDQQPTTAYLWDWVATPHATQAHAYIEYRNKLDALMPASVSTCCPFLIVVTLYVAITPIFFLEHIFLGYLDALRVARDHGTARKPRTQLHVPSRQDIVDDVVSTYLLLHSGVSPPFKGYMVVRARATRTSSMPVHFS